MKKYKIFLTKESKEDLQEISSYISKDLCEPEIAKRILKALRYKIDSLGQMPYRNPVNDEIFHKTKGLRIAIAERYRIFYTVNERDSTVYILRVLSIRREWQSII